MEHKSSAGRAVFTVSLPRHQSVFGRSQPPREQGLGSHGESFLDTNYPESGDRSQLAEREWKERDGTLAHTHTHTHTSMSCLIEQFSLCDLSVFHVWFAIIEGHELMFLEMEILSRNPLYFSSLRLILSGCSTFLVNRFGSEISFSYPCLQTIVFIRDIIR